MNLTGRLKVVIWVMAGLIACATLFVVLGRKDSATFPSSSHYGPSGTRALAEVLAQQGFVTRLESRSAPKFLKSDVVVAFLRLSRSFPDTETERNNKIEKLVEDHVRRGGTALVGYIPRDFRAETRIASETTVSNLLSGAKKTVVTGSSANSNTDYREGLPLWSGNWTATISPLGKGRIVTLTSALPLTNRFLDRADNSEIAMSIIRAIAKPGETIVFAEGGFDPDDPGLLATIGPGMVTGWYQLLFVFALLAYVGGKRLGQPAMRIQRPRGSRDLLDAVADTLTRSKNTKLALTSSLSNARTWIDHWQADNKRQEIPVSLQLCLSRAEAALSEKKIPATLAQQLSLALDREIANLRDTTGKR